MPTSNDLFLVALAVERGLITSAQLEAAVRAQAQDPAAPPLDVLLVEQGALNPAQLEPLHRAGRAAFTQLSHRTEARAWTWRFAARALARGFASPEQVNRALREQAVRASRSGRWTPLGEILVEQGALTADQAAEALRLQKGEAAHGAGIRAEEVAVAVAAEPPLLPHLEAPDPGRNAARDEEVAALRARLAAELARGEETAERLRRFETEIARLEELSDAAGRRLEEIERESERLHAAVEGNGSVVVSAHFVEPPPEKQTTPTIAPADPAHVAEIADLRERLARADRDLAETRSALTAAAARPGGTWIGALVLLAFLTLGLSLWPAADAPVSAVTEAELTRAIAAQPQSFDLRCRRGLLYHRLGRWADAIADFEAAAQLHPDTRATVRAEWEDARAKLAAEKK